MSFFENFGRKNKNKTEVNESIRNQVEKERKAYRENINGLNKDVEKKGGWARVGRFLDKASNFYSEHIAPHMIPLYAGAAVGMAVCGAPAAVVIGYLSVAALNTSIFNAWYQREKYNYALHSSVTA